MPKDPLDEIVTDRRYATPAQQEYIQGLLDELGIDFEEACHEAWLVVPPGGKIQDLEIGEASELLDCLKSLKRG